MNSILSFVLKVLIVSLVISLIIKYLGPLITITPNNFNALILLYILNSLGEPLAPNVFPPPHFFSNPNATFFQPPFFHSTHPLPWISHAKALLKVNTRLDHNIRHYTPMWIADRDKSVCCHDE